MSNTLPILGTNNLGLTFNLPKWDRRLRYNPGTVVLFDTDSDSDTDYRLFINPTTTKEPYLDSETPINPSDDSDWDLLIIESHQAPATGSDTPTGIIPNDATISFMINGDIVNDTFTTNQSESEVIDLGTVGNSTPVNNRRITFRVGDIRILDSDSDIIGSFTTNQSDSEVISFSEVFSQVALESNLNNEITNRVNHDGYLQLEIDSFRDTVEDHISTISFSAYFESLPLTDLNRRAAGQFTNRLDPEPPEGYGPRLTEDYIIPPASIESEIILRANNRILQNERISRDLTLLLDKRLLDGQDNYYFFQPGDPGARTFNSNFVEQAVVEFFPTSDISNLADANVFAFMYHGNGVWEHTGGQLPTAFIQPLEGRTRLTLYRSIVVRRELLPINQFRIRGTEAELDETVNSFFHGADRTSISEFLRLRYYDISDNSNLVTLDIPPGSTITAPESDGGFGFTSIIDLNIPNPVDDIQINPTTHTSITIFDPSGFSSGSSIATVKTIILQDQLNNLSLVDGIEIFINTDSGIFLTDNEGNPTIIPALEHYKYLRAGGVWYVVGGPFVPATA